VSVVANVAINVDARGATEQLKRIRDGALGSSEAFKTLEDRAKAVKAAVEASQGGFAKASTVQGVFSAKVKNTEQAIKAQIQALRNVQSTVQIGGALYQKAGQQIQQYEQVLKNAKGAADGLAVGAKGLSGALTAALGPIAAIAAAVEGFRRATEAAFGRAQAETRLKALSAAYGENAQVAAMAASASEKFGLTQTEASQAIADVYGRLRPLGFGLKEINGVYEGFNVLSKQAALSSAEAGAVFTQLSQALGSGTLRGDEFNRMAENMPSILGAVAKELGVTQVELRGMAADGKISAEVVVKALQGVAAAGGGLSMFLDPVTIAMNDLRKNTEEMFVQIGKLFSPAVVAGMNFLSTAIQKVAEGWQYFSAVLLPKLLAALSPIIEAVKKVTAGLNFETIIDAIQGGLIIAINGIIFAIEKLAPIVAFLIERFAALGQDPVFRIIAEQVGALVNHLVAARGGIDEYKAKQAEATKGAMALVNASSSLPKQIQTAAEANKGLIESTNQVIQNLDRQKIAIDAQIASLERGASITSARYDAEKAINDLQGQQLERQYGLAQTAQRRLDIAVQIFNNSVNAAKIEYNQALENIALEQRKIELQVQLAQNKLKEIEAEGQLQKLKVIGHKDEAEKLAEIDAAVKKALGAQEEVVAATQSQATSQQEIAKYQEQIAGAQLDSKLLAAQTALETKLTSDNIGLSQANAVKLSTELVNSARSTDALANDTRRVADNAVSAANNFISVANNAEKAATAIHNAANAQARLNALQARGGGGGGGKTVQVKAAASGAYWQGGFQAFAKGGIVTKPTLGLIGEGNENEFIIPESKAAGFAANYLSGARGSSAIPSGGGGATTPTISIQTGPVTQMNGQNYVTTQDLSRAVQSGVQQTINMMRNDRGTRRAVGLP